MPGESTVVRLSPLLSSSVAGGEDDDVIIWLLFLECMYATEKVRCAIG